MKDEDAEVQPDLLFRARIDVGPHEFTNSQGETVQVDAYSTYGKVREVVGTARGDVTRMRRDTKNYSLAGISGAEIIGHLEACLADWRVVE